MVSKEIEQARTSAERRGSSLFPRPRYFEHLSFPPHCFPPVLRLLPAARPTEDRSHCVLTSPTGFKTCKCLSVLLIFPHSLGSPFSLLPSPHTSRIHQLLLFLAFEALFFLTVVLSDCWSARVDWGPALFSQSLCPPSKRSQRLREPVPARRLRRRRASS